MPVKTESAALRRSFLSELAPAMVAALCALAALALVLLPDFWARLHSGSWFWLPNHDGWIYLQFFFSHPPSPYPWMLFAPARGLARLWNGGAPGLILAWNAQAALLTTLPLFAWLYSLLGDSDRPRGFAFALPPAIITLFFIFDTGALRYAPLLRQIGVLLNLTHGASILRQPYPPVFAQWDVLSPGLWLGYAFLFLWLVRRAQNAPSRPRKLAAMAALGAAFYVFFYLWTALFGGLLLLALFDRKAHAVADAQPASNDSPAGSGWLFWLQIAAGGLILGLPQLVWLWRRHSLTDWLARNNLGVVAFRLEPFHPGNLLLYGVTLFWLWRRARGLLPAWCVSLAAWLLFYFQPLLSGREYQNFHWLDLRNPLLYLIILLLLAREWQRLRQPWRRWGAGAAGFILLAIAVSGVYIRLRQAAGPVSVRALRQWRSWPRAWERDRTPEWRTGAVIAGPRVLLRLAAIRAGLDPLAGDAVLLNTALNNAAWRRRLALNFYLLHGPRRAAARRAIAAWLRHELFLHSELSWTWVPALRQRMQTQLMADFLRIRRNPRPWVRRDRVRYLALPVKSGRPAWISGWRRLASSSRWRVYQRN